jgi:hypothetical protein
MSYSFRTAVYWYRRALAAVSGRRNLHFLHLRKTGGTAIKSLLVDHPVLPGWIIHCHPHRYVLADVPAVDDLMFVVRDPLERYVSGFKSRQNQGAPAHHVPWSDAERAAFAHFETAEALALALDPAASDHMLALKAMRNISHLRCAYRDWFGSLEALEVRRHSIVFIGRTARLDSDFAILRSALNMPPDMQLPVDDRQSNRSGGGQGASMLSEHAKVLLRAWYADDYRFMDWCDAWWKQQGGPVACRWLSAPDEAEKVVSEVI